MMIILTLLSETSKRSFEIDRCNFEINREPIYTLFIFFFQFSGSKYNYSAAHLESPRGTPVAEHWFKQTFSTITLTYSKINFKLIQKNKSDIAFIQYLLKAYGFIHAFIFNYAHSVFCKLIRSNKHAFYFQFKLT